MIDRRHILKSAAALGILGVMPKGLIRPAYAQNRPFTFCSWGGALSETEKNAFMDPFSKLKNVEILNASPTSYAKVKAMVEANAVEWDLVDVGGQFVYQGSDAGLLEPIDYSIVKADHLEPQWKTEYGVYTSTGASVIAFNTDAFPEGKEPQSWADFWNVDQFPGARSLYGRLYYNYEAAMRAAGVAATDIYPATDEKVKLAMAKLTEIKPHVTVWWTAGAQPPQLLSTGEVTMALAWSGRIFDAMRENSPVSMTFKDAIAWGNAYVVPKATPYRDLAMEVISYAISQEAQERLVPIGTYGPVLASASATASADQARFMVTHPDNAKGSVIFNDQEVAKYWTKWEEDWQKFLLA
jgi:putative spermidine/putrescine transport system substrate-binding protein